MKESVSKSDLIAADRYRALFDNSTDAILIIEDSKFVDCNQAAVDILGYTDKQSLLHCHPSAISPEYQSDGRRSIDKANGILADVFQSRCSQRFEWDHVKADGSILPVEVSMTAIPTGKGDALHILWHDISERRRLEKELRHSQKMEALGNLAGGIAHDFNNTLVPIVTYSDLLSRSLQDQPKLMEWAQEISRAGMLAASMVKKLLTVSRQDDRMPVRLDLESTVASSLGMLRKLIGEDIVVHFHPTGSPLYIETDPGDVEHVLLNLASNARDALPDGGVIDLTLSEARQAEQPFARMEFRDNGVGMDPKTLEQVFTPFFTTKALGSGTGLGMSSVFDLVTKAKGQVNAKSSLGEGTTIEVLFPIVDALDSQSQDVVAKESSAVKIDITNEIAQILVVEDDPQILRLMHDILQLEGYEVRTASNGIKALQTLETVVPDLILADVVLPLMSGPRMVREMNAKGIQIPVMFVSGYTDERLTAHGFDAADVGLIHKPFTAETLLKRVKEALSDTPRDTPNR